MSKTFWPYPSQQLIRQRLQIAIVILLSYCFSSSDAFCQSDEWKGHVQVAFTLGSPVQSIGIQVIGEYRGISEIELAAGVGAHYHFRNYGIPGRHWEGSFFGTGHYLWGDRAEEDQIINFVKHLDSGNSLSSVGYTIERFFNKIGTTQTIGTIHYRAENFAIQFGNDFFGHMNYWDEFRTGAIGLGYIEKDIYFSAKSIFWTGSSHCGEEVKYREGKSKYPARWGYRDITDCPGGKYSHGIFSLGIITDAGFGQNVGGHIGIDTEQYRNAVQNKFFHDMYFIPSFMDNPKNLHIPMKTTDGSNYLYKEDQEIRPAKFVWQLGLNPALVY